MSTQSKQIFLIFGEDEFLVERKCQKIVDSISSSLAVPPFLQVIDCGETQPGRLTEEVSSLSLFGCSVTIVKHFSISAGSRMLSEIESIFEIPLAPGKFLILLPERVDKRLKAYKLMSQKSCVFEIAKMDRNRLITWIIKRFDELDKKVSPEVAEILVELKGGEHTRLIDSEIQKIVAYIGEGKEVTPPDVEAVVGPPPADRVFELIGKVAKKDRLGALNALESLIETGESPIGIVILLSREIRWLIQAHLYLKDRSRRLRPDITYAEFHKTVLEDLRNWLEANGISEKGSLIGQRPYAIYVRFVEAAGFELEYLTELLDRLLEINTSLVSSSMDAKVLLTMLIASIGR